MTDGVGLYLHLPFCVQKCNYCDFCSIPGGINRIDSYITRLTGEIAAYKRDRKIPISTVYFGGGTPSLLTPRQMERIMLSVDDSFNVSGVTELSMEANPGTVTESTLSEYRSLGINRISFGVQSVHENELKKLGRIHSFRGFVKSYGLARAAGFDNISIDLMYGIPEQTEESFSKTLKEIIGLSPEHISVYGLIVEDGTPFGKSRDSLILPDEEAEARMYESACASLAVAGYNHYEISNFSVLGRECRHNLKYWRDEEYIGIGAAAYSCFEGKRYGNSSDFEEYLSECGIKYLYREDINESARAFEYAMMHLRLSEGIDLAAYEREFGRAFIGENADAVGEFRSLGLLAISEGRLYLTERGFYLSNTILANIL